MRSETSSFFGSREPDEVPRNVKIHLGLSGVLLVFAFLFSLTLCAMEASKPENAIPWSRGELSFVGLKGTASFRLRSVALCADNNCRDLNYDALAEYFGGTASTCQKAGKWTLTLLIFATVAAFLSSLVTFAQLFGKVWLGPHGRAFTWVASLCATVFFTAAVAVWATKCHDALNDIKHVDLSVGFALTVAAAALCACGLVVQCLRPARVEYLPIAASSYAA